VLATLYVALSLTLFALGSAESAGRFSLRTLSFGRPTIIVRLILDTVAVSHDVEGMTCGESGRHVRVYNAL
jgi:hypothetical protein